MQALTDRKHVLIVDLGAVFGGVEIYLENLLQAIRPHATCFVLCANHELKRRLEAKDVKYFPLPPCTGIMKALQLLCALAMLPYLVFQYDIDVVQINGYGEIMLIPLIRLLGRTAIATRHLSFDIEVDHWHQAPQRFFARSLYRHLARFATRIICVSKEVGQAVSECAPPDRISVIPNWVKSIPPFELKDLKQDAPVNILFVGRLVEHKGLQVLLEAIRVLKRDQESLQLKVTVVGDGPFRSQLELIAGGLDVHFAGFQPDVRPYYEAADIFVNSSLGPEGMPLVAMEAMARSLPCILSDLPVHREITSEGQAAALFAGGNPVDLARTLSHLINDNSLRLRYAEAGYRTVKLNHNPEYAAEAYARAFGLMEDIGEELAIADI